MSANPANEPYPTTMANELPPFYSGVYVFGDSLVDPGNALRAAEFVDDIPFVPLPKDAPAAEKGYFEGRFTDGYNFADLISNKLLLKPTATTYPYGFEVPLFGAPVPFVDRPQGNNLSFAYGGGQALQTSELVPDLDAQLDAYRNYPAADPNAIYLVTIGGNDVRRLVPRRHDPIIDERASERLSLVAAEIAEEVGQLFTFGARHVLVTGIPDIGLLPLYTGSRNEAERRSLASHYSETLDGLVTTALESLALPADAQLYSFNLLNFSDAIFANPDAYRLTNLTDARTLLQRGALDPIGSGFLFFDEIHPSAQAHALLAAEMLDSLPLNGVAPEWAAPDSSAALPLGTALSGTIDGPSDTDAFTASLVAGQTYAFDLLGISSGLGALADPRMRVVDGSGLVLAEDDDDGLGLDAHLQFVASATADYEIQVASVGQMAGSYLVQARLGGDTLPAGPSEVGGAGRSDPLWGEASSAIAIWESDGNGLDQSGINMVGVPRALDGPLYDVLFG